MLVRPHVGLEISVRVKNSAKALFILSTAVWQAGAQTPAWDTSGNSMLKGTYYFRQVYYELSSAANGTLYDAATAYGNITFSGAGTYTGSVTFVDGRQGEAAGTISGTYSIAASGYGFLSNALATGDLIYGLVNAQGIFVGSDTETANDYNDLFVAAPVSSPPATASTFKGSYSLAYINLSSGTPLTTVNATLQMSPNGVNSLGSVEVSGYIGENGSTKTTQSLAGTYIASNGAIVLTFPNSNTALLVGQYYLYVSPDGNFVFGGSPGGFDMFVGVRTGTGTPSLGGLYYQAGIDQDESPLASGYAILDTYYGAISADAGSIVGHQRQLELLVNGGPFDYTYADSYSLNSDGTYSTAVMNYVVGGDGIRVGAGIGPYLGINVALPAPALSGSGVFLNPTGIVNAASSAPFTARIAPGELLTLSGSNLASSLVIAPPIFLSASLGNVQVTVNGVAAPIYYVSPTQISAIVPYSITGSIAQVQVSNNGTPSNMVTMAVGTTAPGVFTVPPGGLGYGAVLHQDGSLVTSTKPAQIGETVSVFATGLGAVNPTIADGAVGPLSPLSWTTNTITTDISGVTATVTFAGLAPGVAGLYQMNVTIPSGLTAGDNYLDLGGPEAYTSEVLISIAGTSSSSALPVHAAPQAARKFRSAGLRRIH